MAVTRPKIASRLRDSAGFWHTLWRLLVLLRPFPAVLLVVLSVGEAIVVAKGMLIA